MNSPLVTIVIPYYKSERHLRFAIQSALAQEHANLQIVLVNNASPDGSQLIADQYDDPRIERISLETNQGAAAGVQAGYAHARGEWVGLLPADDIWHPEFVRKLMEAAARRPEVNVLFSAFRDIDDDGNVFDWKPRGDWWTTWRPAYESGAFQEELVGWTMIHQFQTMLWRKDLLAETLPFPLEVIPCDWALAIRAFHRNARLLFVDEPLVDNRVHSAQVGATMGEKTYAKHFLYVHLGEFCLPMMRAGRPMSPFWASRFTGYVEIDGLFTPVERVRLLLMRRRVEEGRWPYESLADYLRDLGREELQPDELADVSSLLIGSLMTQARLTEEQHLAEQAAKKAAEEASLLEEQQRLEAQRLKQTAEAEVVAPASEKKTNATSPARWKKLTVQAKKEIRQCVKTLDKLRTIQQKRAVKRVFHLLGKRRGEEALLASRIAADLKNVERLLSGKRDVDP